MIERFLLLSGGYFPEALRKTVLFHAKESMEQARRDGTLLWTDLPLFDLSPLPWSHGIISIPRSFWQRFDTDRAYYGCLVRRSAQVCILALHADPYHRERVALVSGLCMLHEVPFCAHLF